MKTLAGEFLPMTSFPQAPDIISESDYLRQRRSPRPGDPLYIHLSDLVTAITPCLPASGARILDYGSGGSPYQSLFDAPACYHRADFPGVPDLDFTFNADSRIGAPDASYDYILSTQVLEHVADPSTYLNECHRLLRPGAQLLLTTHGLFPDHACPFDYRRWTAEGLKRELEQANFETTKVEKLSTGPRALVFLNQTNSYSIFAPFFSRAGLSLRLAKCLYSFDRGARLHRLCDSIYRQYRVVPMVEPNHNLYIAVLALARRR